MNERKTKGLTNLNSDEKIIRDTCVSLEVLKRPFCHFSVRDNFDSANHMPDSLNSFHTCSKSPRLICNTTCETGNKSIDDYKYEENNGTEKMGLATPPQTMSCHDIDYVEVRAIFFNEEVTLPMLSQCS